MNIKDLEVNPKDLPAPHSGSFMRVLNVSVEAIEKNLGPIYLWDDGKYSSTIYLKYKGKFFSLYCLYTSPRIGSVEPPGLDFTPFNKEYEELADELASVLTRELNPNHEQNTCKRF